MHHKLLDYQQKQKKTMSTELLSYGGELPHESV